MDETGLASYVRKSNCWGQGGIFDKFVKKLGWLIEDVTSPDDRSHHLAHISLVLSLKDLI